MRIAAVKVGGRVLRVESWAFALAEDDNARGDFNHRTGLIRVAEGYTPDVRAEVLLHEVLHALVKDAAVAFPTHEDEERVVEQLAPRLAAFFRDNPATVRELLVMLGCED